MPIRHLHNEGIYHRWFELIYIPWVSQRMTKKIKSYGLYCCGYWRLMRIWISWGCIKRRRMVNGWWSEWMVINLNWVGQCLLFEPTKSPLTIEYTFEGTPHSSAGAVDWICSMDSGKGSDQKKPRSDDLWHSNNFCSVQFRRAGTTPSVIFSFNE